MDIKEVLREKMLAEMISERDAMLCSLFAEHETLKRQKVDLVAKVAELTAQIAELKTSALSGAGPVTEPKPALNS